MIVDTSAIMAILQKEAESEVFRRVISENRPVRLSAASYVELGVVTMRARNPVVSHSPFEESFMMVGLCAGCKKRGGCGYRQPGTWVNDCEGFEELSGHARARPRGDRSAPSAIPSSTQAASGQPKPSH